MSTRNPHWPDMAHIGAVCIRIAPLECNQGWPPNSKPTKPRWGELFPVAVHHNLQPDSNITSVPAGNFAQPLAYWSQIFIPEVLGAEAP